MKRMAAGECRWAGAHSPGSKSCTAVDRVWVEVLPATPGLARRRMRRSTPRSGVTNAPARMSSGSMAAQRQRNGCTRVIGACDIMGPVQGASRCACSTAPTKSSKASVAMLDDSAMGYSSRVYRALFVQPYVLQKQIGLVVKGKIFDIGAVGLEHGVNGDVDPVELLGDDALHLGADTLALLGIQCPTPLPHHGLELGIVDARVIRGATLKKAHRAHVDVEQTGPVRDDHLEIEIGEDALDPRDGVEQHNLGCDADLLQLMGDQGGDIGQGWVMIR